MAATLPILQFEDEILDAVSNNAVMVLIGETGSGKSTQLSQMLYRRGYAERGIIGVTQPRRVATVSVARRVAQELGVQLGEEVGYAIRFEDRTSEKTRIKYLTDGVLLRESLSSPELNSYSVIILDEAHERSLNMDILLGLMKRLVSMRGSKLKVLVTSATLDGEKVSRFFSGCPILNVPGKLFPVEVFYNDERPKNYLDAASKKAIDIHIHEPEGDVLIFMTGQDDIEKLVSRMEERVQNLEEGSCMDAIVLPLHGSLPPEMQENKVSLPVLLNHGVVKYSLSISRTYFISSVLEEGYAAPKHYRRCLGISLHLSFNKMRVFSPAPPNCRRFIVATNIAETSLTVDGVVYVIDSGYVKQRQYNPSTGMYSLEVVPISRVQADQRNGRAGRTRPGKCYRLYTAAVYKEELLDATVPEILRSSLAGSVLYLKSLNLPDMDILQFDYLDPPSYESLQDALRQLYLIDAIDENGSITSIGRIMAELPLEPSLSRTLIEANESGCLSQALTVAAMLSAETSLLPARRSSEKKRKQPYEELPDGSGFGDHIQLLQIFGSWDKRDYDIEWCKERGLQVRGMKFVKNVRRQLAQIMQKSAKGPVEVQGNHKGRERQQNYKNLRKALSVGYANHLAERKLRHNGYRTLGINSELAQVHPSCVLESDEDGMYPNYVVYHELVATSRDHLFIRNVCAVEMSWVLPTLKKLENLNMKKLSGGLGRSEENAKPEEMPRKEVVEAFIADDREIRIQAARDRFLARRGKT